MDESRLRSSILLRMFIVAALTLILLIPAVIIESLIAERQQRRDSVMKEVSDKWGREQIIAGPIVSIPFKKTVKDEKGKESTYIETLHLLPDSLNIDNALSTEIRYRGMYQVVLYNSKATISGLLSLSDIKKIERTDLVPQWNDANIIVGISDLRGVKENIVLNFGSQKYPAKSGVQSTEVVNSGITFTPEFSEATNEIPFSFTLDLNGSSELQYLPLGKNTTVAMHSPWNSPSFIGEYLPETKSIDTKGFSAHWRILELNRNFPQRWFGEKNTLYESSFGVRLLQTANEYQQTYRTAKYAILIISLTFLSFFLSEVIGKELLHPVHYTLVGLALLMFYILVLSLSEHLGFDAAYIISSLSILLLVILYTRSVVANKRVSHIVGGIILVLYIFLYIVLQLEDFALLIGSIGLLFILSAVMYLTRKINWFSVGSSENPA